MECPVCMTRCNGFVPLTHSTKELLLLKENFTSFDSAMQELLEIRETLVRQMKVQKPHILDFIEAEVNSGDSRTCLERMERFREPLETHVLHHKRALDLIKASDRFIKIIIDYRDSVIRDME